MSDHTLLYDYYDNIGGTVAAIKQYQERCRMVQTLCYDFPEHYMPRAEAIKCLEASDWDEVKARDLCTS